MEFSELLNQIIERTGCTAKELSEISGISPASLSRYRSGERMPEYEQMQKLLQGLKNLIKERGVSDIDEEALQASFTEYMTEVSFDYEQFTERLNMLLSALEINMTDLARSLNFDASYLSRIRQGQRRPSDRDGFIRGICQYVIRKKSPSAIARLTGDDPAVLEKDGEGFQCLYKWLSNGVITETGEMDDFLRKLDTFDLGEYIRAIHFDELKVPSVPFQLPSAKHYYGVEAMKQGELDFFKTTVLSKSRKKVFMCSDMPLADMAEDRDFAKKWMFAIAMTLKKDLHFEIIHNIDRPFKEMMYGLEGWIPLYMTGQVAPYYLKGKVSNVYCHFLYVSGAAALCGEAVRGFHDEGQYYLTNKSEEVNYYRKRADRLLEKAQPLMQIYRAENEKSYAAFRQQDAEVSGSRRHIFSSLPLYTMSDELSCRLLKRHGIEKENAERIMVLQATQKELMEQMVKDNTVVDEVPFLSEEEFAKYPMSLSLSDIFYEEELTYTYEEYLQHLDMTKAFAITHANYTVKLEENHAFRNIQIRIHEGKCVIVSKNKAPAIHFVIRHPLMRKAFENFVVPMVEEK